MLMLLFLIVVVANDAFVVNTEEAVCGAGLVENCFGEGGFAAPAVPDKYDVTNISCIGHF
jgi:hypothetical protein